MSSIINESWQQGEDDGDLCAKKFTGLLNRMGSKLLQLKGCLHKEANVMESDFDMSIYMPLIEKYRNEIGVLDAMKLSRCMSNEIPDHSLDSLSSMKQKYHYCLDELQNVSLCSNRSRISVSPDRHNNISPRSTDTAGNPTASIRTSCRDMGTTVKEFIGEDETDSKFNRLLPVNISQITSRDVADDDLEKNSVRQFLLDPSAVTNAKAMDEVSSSDGYEYYDHDVGHTEEKYKVVRKKLSCRHRVYNEHFYPVNSTLRTSFLDSNPACFGFPENSIIDDVNSTLDNQLFSEPKNANESWYDYKERLHSIQNRFVCSQNCLPQSQNEYNKNDSDSRMDVIDRTATYSKHGQSSSNCFSKSSKTKKSVSFCLSPATSSDKGVEENCEDDSSDSSVEVSFENDDFPRKSH